MLSSYAFDKPKQFFFFFFFMSEGEIVTKCELENLWRNIMTHFSCILSKVFDCGLCLINGVLRHLNFLNLKRVSPFKSSSTFTNPPTVVHILHFYNPRRRSRKLRHLATVNSHISRSRFNEKSMSHESTHTQTSSSEGLFTSKRHFQL